MRETAKREEEEVVVVEKPKEERGRMDDAIGIILTISLSLEIQISFSLSLSVNCYTNGMRIGKGVLLHLNSKVWSGV